ncbi:hypothetical protein MES4922_40162 [Mesorhizobium ventifaucium]|uniref:Uncharacterized protein n=1 Tax=Mesorhizobium ventifaucium TaxID=666020 RepID=A0ABM9E925_9HYPH|nr:hypothetical protein MES4922_40162 [Mesorhizobium ventifaucium]
MARRWTSRKYARTWRLLPRRRGYYGHEALTLARMSLLSDGSYENLARIFRPLLLTPLNPLTRIVYPS